jgi:hypothetical protein
MINRQIQVDEMSISTQSRQNFFKEMRKDPEGSTVHQTKYKRSKGFVEHLAHR